MILDVWQSKELEANFSDVWQIQGLTAERHGFVGGGQEKGDLPREAGIGNGGQQTRGIVARGRR
jgi:hypothetical protein